MVELLTELYFNFRRTVNFANVSSAFDNEPIDKANWY